MKKLLLVGLLALGACKKNPVLPTVDVPAAAALEVLRGRELPDPLQGRFGIRLHSKPLGIAGTTTGGLVVDRPGKAHFAVLMPLGSPVFALTTDGEALGILDAQAKEYVVGRDAAATGGAVQVDDLVALLLGQVALEDEVIRSQTVLEGDLLQVTAEGPGDTQLVTTLDGVTATPTLVQVLDAKGATAVQATYEPFLVHEGVPLPSRVILEVPSVELTIDIRYKGWKTLEEAPPVFDVVVPKGFTEVPLPIYIERMRTDALAAGAQ